MNKDAHIKNREFYKNKKILVTGHTGFKGTWLCVMLDYLMATAVGYALKPCPGSLFTKINGYEIIKHVEGDIRDYTLLKDTINNVEPDIVFHLAAMAQVKDCYDDPINAYSTNIMGTVNLLEAVKKSSVKSVVIITTDKVYENKGDGAIYSENDLLGGADPYATSKSSMELIAKAYKESYFLTKNIGIATIRASNVLAGGDHIQTRLIPSILNSLVQGTTFEIRNPHQTRPWQSVLDALNGYLTIGRYLYQEPNKYSEGWNIGPTIDGIRTVSSLVNAIKESFINLNSKQGTKLEVKESETLGLDITKALQNLDWEPRISFDELIKSIVYFFSAQQHGINEKDICYEQVKDFFEKK